MPPLRYAEASVEILTRNTMPTIADAASDIRVRHDMICAFLRLISSYPEPSPADLALPPCVSNNPSFSENQVGPWSIRARSLGASKERSSRARNLTMSAPDVGQWPRTNIEKSAQGRQPHQPRRDVLFDAEHTNSDPNGHAFTPAHSARRTSPARFRSPADGPPPICPALPRAATSPVRDRSVRNRPAAEWSGIRCG
jgi:hypothetical protein